MTDTVKVKVTAEDEGVSALLRTLSKQLGDVQKAQSKANAEASAGAKEQNALAKSVTSTIGSLKQLAVSYAALQVLHFVDDQIKAADALGKLAQKTGATTEALSVLAFAGETADVSMDQLTVSMAHLAKSLTALQQNDRATADAFAAIGLSAASLKGLSVDDAFKKIANALGGFQDSSDKATVAMQIFGKSGAELIPLLNDLSNGGFDDAAAQAQKFGRVVSTEAAKAAERFNDQLRVLKGQAQGTALTLGQEVVPAISDVLTALSALRGDGEQTFAQTLGAGAAKAIKFTALIGITAFKTIGDALGDLAVIGVETFRAIKSAATGSFDEAKQHLQIADIASGELRASGQNAVKIFNDTRDALDKAEKDRDAQSVDARKKRENAEKKRITLQNSQQAAELAKARADAEQHAREGEAKLLADNLALNDTAVQRAFEKGLTNLDAYFASRKQTIVQAGQAEIAALKASRDALQKVPVLNETDKVKRDDSVSQLNVQIREKEVQLGSQLFEIDTQREAQAKTLAEAVVDAETRMQTARGNTSAEAEKSLARDVENYRLTLAKIGKLTADQQAQAVNEFRVTLTLDVNAKQNKEKIDALFGSIEQKRTELDGKVSAGLLSQADADRQLLTFERDRVPFLKDAADEAERLAFALGDPALIAAAQALQAKVATVGVALSESAKRAVELKSDIGQAIESDLSEFLGSTVSQVHSLGEAFASLATSVVSSIQRIVAQLIAAKAVEGIASILGIGSGATPFVNAGGGTGVESFGGFFAQGGLVRGPGSATSDSIPARLSDGEYVIKAAAVRKVGLAKLDAINGMQTPNIVRPRRGYADGGLVSASVGGNISGTIHLSVDEGVILRAAAVHLESDTGQRQVLKVVTRHKGAVRGILG